MLKTVDAIEQKEIRGLSIRALGWLVTSTVTIVSFVIASYFLLQNKIEQADNKIETVKVQKINDDKYIDLRLQVMQSDIKLQANEIEALRNQIMNNARNINELKK